MQGQERPAFAFAAAAALVLLAGLAACGPSVDPIERARVASGRPATTGLPAVPGENAPYPNLGSVPPRPETMPPAERQALANQLVADRTNARYVGQPVVPTQIRAQPAAARSPVEAAPLEPSSSGLLGAEDVPAEFPAAAAPMGAPPSPEPPPIAGAPPALPVPPQQQTSSLPAAPIGMPNAAASVPPAPLPVATAPVTAISAEPLAPPPAPAMPEELPARARTAPPPAPEAIPPAAAAVATAPVLVPPSPVSQAAPRPAPPPLAAAAAPLAPPAPPQPVQPSVVIDRTALQPGRVRSERAGYALSFLPGTTTIVASDRAVLASLASRGQGATFRVTGYADEAGTGRALDLPIARAQAVASALRAAGVAAEAIELGGSAQPGPAGRGAEVTLLAGR